MREFSSGQEDESYLRFLQCVNRKQEATSALAVLRGYSYDPSEELAEMQRAAEEAASRKLSIFDLVRAPATRRAMLVSLAGMFFQQMSGVNAVIFYTVDIFRESGSSIPASIASIIVALVQVRLPFLAIPATSIAIDCYEI